ncbi:hypothetical protein SSX86_001702 [Deinandra increscens subsp. villosa]|uniref:BED-type domain-containing protein n=1 Tax=Deinandra increscens subsp. villosa TaxID=3103831 RepID=A0AAP0DWP7_9ASTR
MDGQKDDVQQMNEKKAGKRKVPQKKRKLTGKCWQYFEEFYDEEGLRKGSCNYSKKVLCAKSSSNGTSSLNKHLNKCENNPVNKKQDQPELSLKKSDDGQEADRPIKDMTLIAEYIGDVDYINNREHGDCESMMTLLLASDPSKSLVICPDQCGNIARFINGINNFAPESKKKQVKMASIFW